MVGGGSIGGYLRVGGVKGICRALIPHSLQTNSKHIEARILRSCEARVLRCFRKLWVWVFSGFRV